MESDGEAHAVHKCSFQGCAKTLELGLQWLFTSLGEPPQPLLSLE